VHASYDITLEQMAEIMHKKKMEMLYGSMILDKRMLNDDEGILDDLDAHYLIKKKNGIRRIFFSFVNDASAGYDHDYEEYIRYLFSTVISYGGSTYSYSVIKQRGSTLYFSMAKIDGITTDLLPDMRPYVKNSETMVRVYSVAVKKEKLYSYNDPRAYEPIEFLLPKDAWNQILSKLLINDKWDRAQVHSFIRSVNARFIINGIPISFDKKIEAEYFEAAVTALTVVAFRKKYELGMHVNMAIEAEKQRRFLFEGGSIFTGILKKTYSKLVNTLFSWSNGIEANIDIWKKSIEVDGRFVNVFKSFSFEYVYVKHGLNNLTKKNIVSGNPWDLPDCYLPKEQKLDPFSDYSFSSAEELEELIRLYVPEKLELFDEVKETIFPAEDDDGDDNVQEESVPKKKLKDFAVVNEVEDVEKPTLAPFFTVGSSDENLTVKMLQCRESSYLSTDLGDKKVEECTKDELLQEAVSVLDEGHRYHLICAMAAVDEARLMWNLAKTAGHTVKDYLSVKQDEKVKPNVLYLQQGGNKIISSMFPTDFSYMAGIAENGDIVKIHSKKRNGAIEYHVRGVHKRIFVTEQLRVFNGEDISLRLQSVINDTVIADDFVFPLIKLVDGVSGSGKTSHIKASRKKGELIVVAGADPARKLRAEMVKDKLMTEDEARKYVRTFDSYVLRPDVQCDVVYFDEVFMVHSAMIYAVLLLAKAKYGEAYGDNHQIPFVNFQELNIKVDYVSYKRFSSIALVNISRRYGTMTAMLLSLLYGFKVYTMSKVRDEIDLKFISSIADVPKGKNNRYLTYVQDDKAEIARNVSKDVATIHESEGNTYYVDHTILTRLSWKPNDIYGKEAYNIVGASRHTKKFTYMTVTADDVLARLIQQVIDRKHEQENYYVDENDVDRIKLINSTPRSELLI
jgi:hypothetical protein